MRKQTFYEKQMQNEWFNICITKLRGSANATRGTQNSNKLNVD